MRRYALALLASVLFLIAALAGCSSSGSKCYVLDKRFSCEAGFDAEGPYLTLTKVPPGKFTVQRILMTKDGTEGASQECLTINGNAIEQGGKMSFQCPKGEGKHHLSIKIMHAEQSSYSPAAGETCLKQSNRWQCDTRAGFSFTFD